MPKDQPKPGLIVQMTHGMVEHMGRYEELAQYLNAHGIGAIGHDTLGHGKSAPTSSQDVYKRQFLYVLYALCNSVDQLLGAVPIKTWISD